MDNQDQKDGLLDVRLRSQMFDPPITQRVMIRARPILWIPEGERKYPNFLAWWEEVGRLHPTDPQNWGAISAPWAMRGRIELIDESDWEALPQAERDLIEQWTETLPTVRGD